MKKPLRSYIAAIMRVSLFILISGQAIARQGDIVIETETLSMTGKRENANSQARVTKDMHTNEKVIVTEQIIYTGNRSKQQ